MRGEWGGGGGGGSVEESTLPATVILSCHPQSIRLDGFVVKATATSARVCSSNPVRVIPDFKKCIEVTPPHDVRRYEVSLEVVGPASV